MPVAGEVEQRTGSPFWGSKGEEEGQKEAIGGGGGAQWCRLLRPEKDRDSSTAPVWGRVGAAAWIQWRWLGLPESEGRRHTVGRREGIAGGECRGR
jgi:hypothetical protein